MALHSYPATEVWMGDVSLRKAQSEKRLKIVGSPVYLKNLQC